MIKSHYTLIYYLVCRAAYVLNFVLLASQYPIIKQVAI